MFAVIRSIRFLLILALAASVLSAFATPPDGRALYKKYCVECHGKNGEGVKGKYDHALFGDRTLDRLARYIDKNMPEDHPEKIDAAQSEAVAKYIYDSFYSLEARLKKQSVRVELAHLTNRQYVNSVADLIGQFMDRSADIGSERGLRGSYYDSRNFQSDKKIYDRVDAELNFDYGAGGPEKMTTNEFSIQWHGSLIAEDSGVYEIIVKTPLGMRLWLDDDQEPLIDAWVSSAQMMEYKASLRLIGGRAYPLRLDCFRFKDKVSSISLQWKPPHGPQQVIPTRNLTPSRTSPTFVLRTPFPADDSSIGYERGVSISKEWDEATARAALEVAGFVTKKLDRFTDSKPGDTNRLAKAQAFCAKFVGTAFRRPLTPEEKKVYVDTHFKAALKPEESVKRVVLATLKSPHFLYVGLGSKNPDGYEIASRLSYELWDSIPDPELLKAAGRGELKTGEQVEKQARRMLSDARTHEKIRYFLHRWLQTERGDDLSKDPKIFPEFTPEIAADLRASLDLFLNEEVWNGASDYRRLLLADYIFANDRIAKFYGLESPGSNGFAKVKLDARERSGVITHPFLLTAFSYSANSSPIHRGVFLTRNVVGRALRPPPMAVAFSDADFPANLTMREKVTKLTEPKNCQGCHSVINPLGFTLEHFDAVGRFRSDENGKAIDTTSEYQTEDGATVKLKGPRDVAEFAVNSPEAQKAFVEQLFHHLVKQPVLAYGRDTLEALRKDFAGAEFNVQKLIVDIAAKTCVSSP